MFYVWQTENQECKGRKKKKKVCIGGLLPASQCTLAKRGHNMQSSLTRSHYVLKLVIKLVCVRVAFVPDCPAMTLGSAGGAAASRSREKNGAEVSPSLCHPPRIPRDGSDARTHPPGMTMGGGWGGQRGGRRWGLPTGRTRAWGKNHRER